MKTLKITLSLIAVVLLTVSGMKSEDVAKVDETTYQPNSVNFDLLAHNKAKMKIPSKN